jgi:hypothetical protein
VNCLPRSSGSLIAACELSRPRLSWVGAELNSGGVAGPLDTGDCDDHV